MRDGKHLGIVVCAVISTIIVSTPCRLHAVDEYAGDTAIFNGAVSGVKSNVLIIFDTSGSMGQEPKVCDNEYIPATDYTGSGDAVKNQVQFYYENQGWGDSYSSGWYNFPDKSASSGILYTTITCATALASLQNYGWWEGYIATSSPYGCGGSKYVQLRTKNYIAYRSSGCGTQSYKIDVARKAIIQLLTIMQNADGTDPVRWGLMAFPNSSCFGGTLLKPCGTASGNSTTSGTIIYELTHNNRFSTNPSGGTPIAETLAEAGLYFAGQKSWVTGTTYTSPIQHRCQQNYIVIITDGNSQCDRGDDVSGKHLFTDTYLNNKRIGDYDSDGCDPDGGCVTFENNGSHYLDDVAKFLHDEDLITTGNDASGISFQSTDYLKQSCTIYTIGFGEDTTAIPLLTRTAQGDWAGTEGTVPTNGNYGGGGKFFRAQSTTELVDSLNAILGNIRKRDSNFISPVVPVSKMNRVYSGNSIYLGLFRPWSEGHWRGNLKKFGIDSNGMLLQKDGSQATDGGVIKSESVSCWNSVIDGDQVVKGGAAQVLLGQTNRVFLTYNPTTAIPSLTNSANLFNKTNTAITPAILSLSTAAQHDDLIDFMRAEGIYNPVTGSSALDWVMGDVLHSRPAVMYDGNNTIIFVGANDGYMHCFVDDDKGDTSNLANDTVSEAWCFVPWELFSTLKELHPTYKSNTIHNYFVDGSPTLYTLGSNKYLTFGLRRGGSSYYTLDVGNVNTSTGDLVSGSYTSPEFAWQITSSVLGASGEVLGESWFKPIFCKLKTAAGQTAETYPSALLFTGGYDNANQDLDAPSTSGDSKGRAIFAVNPSTGAVLSTFNFSHTGGQGQMDFSIVDMIAFDAQNNGCIDTVYAGDLGGNLFAFKDRDGNGSWSDNGSPLSLFKATNTAAAATKYLKFFYAPDVVLETFGDYVYIGSGDREHPNETTTVNRFYAIKNFWSTTNMPMSESTTNFVDVTGYAYATTYPTYWLQGDECKGWYIKMPHTGEKVVSSPLVYNGVVYFTSFVPEAGNTATDACATSGLGNGYVWAINYLTGEAVFNFNTANDTVDAEGHTQPVYDATDRYKSIGQGMPTQPTLIVTSTGAKILIGTDKGVVTLTDPTNTTVNRYFWRQN